jgi:hypothetical protein
MYLISEYASGQDAADAPMDFLACCFRSLKFDEAGRSSPYSTPSQTTWIGSAIGCCMNVVLTFANDLIP